MINFTNLSDQSIMIESYIIEQLNKNGQWEEVSLPYGQNGTTYYGATRKDVREIQYVTFDWSVGDKNIATNETVRGWVFLAKPLAGKLRLKVISTTGFTSTQPIEANPTGGWAIQPQMTEYLKEPHDISGLPIAK